MKASLQIRSSLFGEARAPLLDHPRAQRPESCGIKAGPRGAPGVLGVRKVLSQLSKAALTPSASLKRRSRRDQWTLTSEQPL